MDECKAMNARVVLPRNRREGTEFLKFSPERTWIGLWNTNRTIGRESWRDGNGTKPKYANLRVEKSLNLEFWTFFFDWINFLTLQKWYKSQPQKDSVAYWSPFGTWWDTPGDHQELKASGSSLLEPKKCKLVCVQEIISELWTIYIITILYLRRKWYNNHFDNEINDNKYNGNNNWLFEVCNKLYTHTKHKNIDSHTNHWSNNSW